MAEGALLEPADPAWADALRRVHHDVYHLPGYVTLDADRSGGTPVAFRYDEMGQVFLLPLVLRPIPGTGLRDAASPYGYPGPVSDVPASGAEFWERAVRHMSALLRTHDVVSVFARLHPLLPAPIPALEAGGAVVRHGETVSADLTRTPEQLWQETGRTHRNQINKAVRAGVRVVMDDWDLLEEWVDTYHATMRRVGATGFYFFDLDYFQRLRAAVGEHVHLAAAVRDSEVLGGNLFFAYRGIMQTHLQSTRDGDIRWADKLLYHEVRLWGRERGHLVHHIGGGLGGADDSLFRYKAGFAAGRQDFHTWRLVCDPLAFEKLAGAPTAETMAGRFPPYR